MNTTVPQSRALLVIDVQNEYFSGQLPITHPVGHLDTILAAMTAARRHGVPVVAVRHAQPATDSPIFCRGSHAWQLHTAVAEIGFDHLVDKQLPGSFTGTDLHEWLQARGIETVAIAGYMTQMCCDTTARQAMHRGYRVEFLSDATGTLSVTNAAGAVTAEELHRATLVAQQMFIAEVLPAAAWQARLE